MSTPGKDHHTVVTPNPGDKPLDGISVQGITQTFARDKAPEQIVTRKELWSYYRMTPHGGPRLYKGLKQLYSVLQWQ